MDIKSTKMVKSLFSYFFFFSKLQQVLYERHFFCFDQILLNLAHTSTFAAHHEKSFVPAFLSSLLITYLITLSLEKEILNCLEKKSGKSLKFWIQKSVQILCVPLHFD